jgi:hypothetical protein
MDFAAQTILETDELLNLLASHVLKSGFTVFELQLLSRAVGSHDVIPLAPYIGW